MNARVARALSIVLFLLAGGSLAVELFLSHGWADAFWGATCVLLAVGGYALRYYARTVLIYERVRSLRTEDPPR